MNHFPRTAASCSIQMLASPISPDEYLRVHTKPEIRPTHVKPAVHKSSYATPAAHRAPGFSGHAETWEARRFPSHPSNPGA